MLETAAAVDQQKKTELEMLDSKRCLFYPSLWICPLSEILYSIGIFLDLKKAFDVCDHEVLFKKLENKGVTGKSLECFKS